MRHAAADGGFHDFLLFADMNLVQNKAGKTNLRALQDRQKIARHSGGTMKPKGDSGYKFAGIETLNVSLGKVTLLKMKESSFAAVAAGLRMPGN